MHKYIFQNWTLVAGLVVQGDIWLNVGELTMIFNI